MIRLAVENDRMTVIAMAKSFHAASGLPFPFSAPMADRIFRMALGSKDALCLVLDVDGKARGVLAAEAQMHRFAPVMMAFELIFWIEPDQRGQNGIPMLDAYEAWARGKGCMFANMVGLGGDPTTTKFYERRGYHAIERQFMKPL